VPHIIEELLGRKMVVAPSLDIPSPQPLVVGGMVVEVRSVAVCTPGSPLVKALMVVAHETTDVQVLLSPSLEPVTRSSFAQVIMTQCISYVTCHGKVANSFKANPHELTASSSPP
jgi:hypothetical protein